MKTPGKVSASGPAKRTGIVRREFLKLSVAASCLLLASCKLKLDLTGEKPITRLAFGSCNDQNWPQPIWDVISRTNPDLFVFLGDNIYGDTDDMKILAQKYQEQDAKPEFKRFRERVPLVATWDDHDLGLNDAGSEFPHKAESKRLMLDFFGEPQHSERRSRDGVYTSYVYGPPGKRVQLILLDLRWFRTPLVSTAHGYAPNPDPNATILGAEQWSWLEQELQKPAEVRIIGSSVQFSAPTHPWEKWANFPADKARLIALIDRLQIRNAIFISGDMHYGELSSELTPGGIRLYDLTSSGLSQGRHESAANYPNPNRIAVHDTTENFGLIEIDWSRAQVGVLLNVFDDKGSAVIRKEILV